MGAFDTRRGFANDVPVALLGLGARSDRIEFA
jgi:hypothetical protein